MTTTLNKGRRKKEQQSTDWNEERVQAHTHTNVYIHTKTHSQNYRTLDIGGVTNIFLQSVCERADGWAGVCVRTDKWQCVCGRTLKRMACKIDSITVD